MSRQKKKRWKKKKEKRKGSVVARNRGDTSGNDDVINELRQKHLELFNKENKDVIYKCRGW